MRTLIEGEQPPGSHEFRWSGDDEHGRPVAAGIYHYRLDTAGTSMSRRLVLLGR